MLNEILKDKHQMSKYIIFNPFLNVKKHICIDLRFIFISVFDILKDSNKIKDGLPLNWYNQDLSKWKRVFVCVYSKQRD